ncbi:MAG TPA: undecaprenyldiphospho-muramoylpentapeptide beta-N-acetylglucosaminyltransferase [Candidatus Krumholzibacteria bacterium]|nr:undecaprenyldiphospho-muramoylpentapeptide beta-N-acetylglucosaminyltransferase [Candidatus Krumholzibacteria bacterium]
MGDTLRIMVAGGGTGGHVYPGIAIVEAIAETSGVEALFIGAQGGVEQGIFERAALAHSLLPGYGLRRASLSRKLAAPFNIAAGVLRASKLLHAFRPDVVLGTGGFASATVVMASVLARVPRVLQEQNSVPGLVNRRLARYADLMLLGYEESRAWLPERVATRVVGNPIRRLPRTTREEAARFFGLDASRPVVLVIGGSRGAHSLNIAGADAAARLARSNHVQFVILAGRADRKEAEARVGDAAGVRVLEYLDEVHMAYSLADIAVARSGASSCFELALFGVPAVFVPYPFAADDHQEKNASPLVQAGAALVIGDAELTGENLASVLVSLLDDPARRNAMSAAMHAWSKPNAAADAAGAILEIAKKKERGAVAPLRQAA